MELLHGTIKEDEFAQEDDVISSVPDFVITNILDRLPIQDAVRTGILSRSWRYKWTLLSQLVFDDNFFYYLEEKGDKAAYEKIISRLLLHLKGAITKFYFDMQQKCYSIMNANDINHWILFLSTKGIQDLTILNMHKTPLKLSTHLFSCLQLKHLKLRNCHFHHAPGFCGFPNLLSLDFMRVKLGNSTCGEVIARCPSLEILNITYHDAFIKMEIVEIAKLENPKLLSLPLRKLDDITITSSNIFQLGDYLPKLEELNLNFPSCEFREEDSTRIWICNAFPTLKTLGLCLIDFSSGIMSSWAFEMIWGSPNLQTLSITACSYTSDVMPLVIYSSEVDHTTLGQLQLQSVVFSSFRGSENEVYLVKCLLASSPLLKSMSIHSKSSQVFGGEKGKLTFSTKLLKFRRASPLAEVDLHWN